MPSRRLVVGALPLALGAAATAAVPVACFGRIAPTPDDGGPFDAAAAEASDADDDASRLNDGRGPAPVPSCVGQLSQCVHADGGGFVGAVAVTCAAVYFVGPWNLLLERETSAGQFTVIEKRAVLEPGFPTAFEDPTAQGLLLTYRVCVVDELGTRCGDPFVTTGPPDCVCKRLSCVEVHLCNTTFENGCGGQVNCGACSDGTPCNEHSSCCPPGMGSDGVGTCECAPPRPCPRGSEWDVGQCKCLNAR